MLSFPRQPGNATKVSCQIGLRFLKVGVVENTSDRDVMIVRVNIEMAYSLMQRELGIGEGLGLKFMLPN
jgi:hypothetical protein